MHRRLVLLPLLLSLTASALTLAPPAAADLKANVSPEIIYTTRKEFLRVAPAHPLTLNAHLTQFAYDPLGLEVAAVGSETAGDTTTYFVKTLAVKTGREFHRLTVAAPVNFQGAGFTLLGWSPSGKYLLAQRDSVDDPQAPAGVQTEIVRWDLSADPPVVKVIDPAAHVPVGAQPVGTSPLQETSSIGKSRLPYLTWRQDFRTPDADGKLGPRQLAYLLYDVERDTYRLSTHDGVESGWSDNTHLRFSREGVERQMDLVTGQIGPPSVPTPQNVTDTSKQYPDLTLDTESKMQRDKVSKGAFGSHIVWVRCQARGKQPLSAVGAGITMGDDDSQAVWSPTGKQFAFLNRGELYVSDIAPVPNGEGLADEKLVLGLPLTCREERMLARSNLKQIGLGIMQYTQDSDEKFPPAGGVDETILPYIKDRSVFSIGSVHWAYHAPSDLSMAAMDAPTATVLGTMDLPCGQVVLYADGHVKEITGKD